MSFLIRLILNNMVTSRVALRFIYLVDTPNYFHEGLDKPSQYAYLSTIDLTKSFDRVNHNVIKKLIELGVRRSIVPIVCDIVTGRTHNTKLKTHISTVTTISSGVRQGTKLGPILFLILVNDAAIESHRRWKYVDDLTLGEIIEYDEQPQLQNHLNVLSEWCSVNDVLPKPAKCHIMKICFF